MRTLALAVTLLVAPLAGAATPPSLAAQVDAYVKSLGSFSGTLLVARDGKIVLERSYGLADAEHEVKNAPYTKFRIGSITKQFTAALVLMLEREGRLGVSDSVCRHLQPCPKAWQGITLHELLTHTSGIPNYTDQPDFEKTMMLPTTPAAIVQKMAKLPLELTPGTKHKYSNTGYEILGLVVEKAAGKPYEEVLRERILEPLGMHDSGYDHPETILPHRAHGYRVDANGKRTNAAYIDMSIPFAAGAMYSTVEDLLKWDQALYRDELLPKAARDRMFTPFLDHYAYGWLVGDLAGHNFVAHDGGINGFAAHFARYVDDHVTIAVLCNDEGGNAGEAGVTLARLALGLGPPKARVAVSLPAATLERYVGEYQLAPGFSIVIRHEGDGLTAQATGQPRFPIFAETTSDFFLKVVDAQITFQGEPGRPATTLVLHQNGRDLPGKRIDKETR